MTDQIFGGDVTDDVVEENRYLSNYGPKKVHK